MVYPGAKITMRGAMAKTKHSKTEVSGTHRLSISLSPEQHAELVAIAQKNKVSVAWVVREAIERLLYDEQPLFHMRRAQ